MRRAISNYRWITAVFCLITMLSAFVVIGGSTQKLVETSEQIELEECKELIQAQTKILMKSLKLSAGKAHRNKMNSVVPSAISTNILLKIKRVAARKKFLTYIYKGKI